VRHIHGHCKVCEKMYDLLADLHTTLDLKKRERLRKRLRKLGYRLGPLGDDGT